MITNIKSYNRREKEKCFKKTKRKRIKKKKEERTNNY